MPRDIKNFFFEFRPFLANCTPKNRCDAPRRLKMLNFSHIFNPRPLCWSWNNPNNYWWSYMVVTDMPDCILTCFGVNGVLQGWKLVKNKQKMADFAPKSQISDLVSLYCAGTSPMTVIDYRWLKLICQYVFWPVLGYMGFFRAENWSKISKKWPILPQNHENPIWCLFIVLGHPQWL